MKSVEFSKLPEGAIFGLMSPDGNRAILCRKIADNEYYRGVESDNETIIFQNHSYIHPGTMVLRIFTN